MPESDPDSKVYGANMGPIWGRQDLGGPHVGPMNFAIWGPWSQITTNAMAVWIACEDFITFLKANHASYSYSWYYSIKV